MNMKEGRNRNEKDIFFIRVCRGGRRLSQENSDRRQLCSACLAPSHGKCSEHFTSNEPGPILRIRPPSATSKAVPLQSEPLKETLMDVKRQKCAPVHPHFQAVYPRLNDFVEPKSLTGTVRSDVDRCRLPSATVTHQPDPNFVKIVPVKSQFSSYAALPDAMRHASLDDPMVNFFPVVRKGDNYVKYCCGWLAEDEKPLSIDRCVWKYTSGRNWFCSQVNMALASDSPKLAEFQLFIRQLKYSIGMSPMNFHGTVFRGE